MRKMPPLVLVQWEDSVTSPYWKSPERVTEFMDERVGQISSIGFLLRKTKKQIVLAQCLDVRFLDEEYDDNLRINAASERFFEPAPERSFYVGVSSRF